MSNGHKLYPKLRQLLIKHAIVQQLVLDFLLHRDWHFLISGLAGLARSYLHILEVFIRIHLALQHDLVSG